MDQFAERGFGEVTVRDIAGAAGMSAASVIHHFGSKDGLRQECDRRVLEFVDRKRRSGSSGRLDAVLVACGLYLARALADDSVTSRPLFDAVLAVARDVVEEGTAAGGIRASADPDAQAAALVVLGLAPFCLAAALRRWSGSDLTGALERIATPIAEIYTHGLVTEDALLAATRRATGSRS